MDLVYIDPPYNQHPYGSNYFMLNLVTKYERPQNISRVSGIPVNWNRSVFNKKREAFLAFKRLFEQIESKYYLISYNNEGFISIDELIAFLSGIGRVMVTDIPYVAFRASRNLSSRPTHTIEYLILVER